MTNRDLSEVSVQLSPEQQAFLQAHHEIIEYAWIAAKQGDASAIEALVASFDYQRLFGTLSWNDVYDRYQDTPGYDDSLAKALNQQLAMDLASGKVKSPETSVVRQPDFTVSELAEMGLRRLNE